MLRKIFYTSCLVAYCIAAQSQTLFPIKDTVTNLYGYKPGFNYKWTIKPKFETAKLFMEGYAIVSVNELFGVINKKGNYVITPKYEMLEGERYLTYKSNDTSGIVLSTGKVLLAGKFSHIYYDPSKGSALMVEDNLYGYWDTLGNYVAPISKYELAFENGISYYDSGKNQGFINKQGKKTIEVEDGKLWDIHPYGYISSRKLKECVYDSNGNPIGECIYGKIIQMRKEIILYTKDDRYGIMNYKGENVLFDEYEYISPFNERGISIVKKNDKYGLINEQLQVVLPLEHQAIEEYGKSYNRLFGKYDQYFNFSVFKRGDHFGVINDSGRVVIEPQYDMAMIDGNNLLKFVYKDRLGLHDLRKLQKLPLTHVYTFVKDKTIFCIDNNGVKCGIADKEGKILVMPVYKDITPTPNGYAIVKNYYGTGMVNDTGKIVVPPVYDNIKTLDEVYRSNTDYSGDFAWDNYLYVQTRDKKRGVVTEVGNLIIDTAYVNVTAFDDDGQCWFAQEENGTYRMIDAKGKKLSPKLLQATVFNQGVAVAKKGKYGLISSKGKTIVPFKYQNIIEDVQGLYYFQSDSLWGLMNRSGKALAPAQFSLRAPFILGYAFVKKGNEWGMLDTTGKFETGFNNLKKINDPPNSSKVSTALSFSHNNIKRFDEISFDLLKEHPLEGACNKVNSLILESMGKLCSENKTQDIIFAYPENMVKKEKGNYEGYGVEILSVNEHIFTLNYFKEESVNGDMEVREQYKTYFLIGGLPEEIQFKSLFANEDYLIPLNTLVKKKIIELGLGISDCPNLSSYYESNNFLITEKGLKLKLRMECFEDGGELPDVELSFEEIKPMVKLDGPLQEFYK